MSSQLVRYGAKPEKLALLSPNAIVNIIRNYAVAGKKTIEIPPFISEIVQCPNENCICNTENKENKVIYIRYDDINLKYVYLCTYNTHK